MTILMDKDNYNDKKRVKMCLFLVSFKANALSVFHLGRLYIYLKNNSRKRHFKSTQRGGGVEKLSAL